MNSMQNLIRRGNTWFARFFIPQTRWSDVGKATGAVAGTKREVVRTLQTTDRHEAKRRLGTALAAIQADIDAALKAAGVAPLTDWTAGWTQRAVEIRAALEEADPTPRFNLVHVQMQDGDVVEVGASERDFLMDDFREEAEELEKRRGYETAAAFWRAATADQFTLDRAAEQWLAEASRTRKRKTIEGHRAVLANLEQFLRRRHVQQSLMSTTFNDVTRKVAGQFIEWRATQVSAAAVKREFSTPMGLWRWAIRRGHTEVNPWTDQTAGLERHDGGHSHDASKRPFSATELVTLLTATGNDWAPNGGGYGATLWDAIRLALLTGLRAGELADLRLCDLVENGTAVFVRRGKSKNARRIVPLPEVAQTVLAMRLAELLDASPDAPLWPELPVLGLTGSRGGKLSDRFRLARARLLPTAGVDFHSFRRAYATALEAAMNDGGRINPTIIDSLIGHQRGTLALDTYSGGPALTPLRNAVDDMATKGLDEAVRTALADTMNQRPRMVRFAPASSGGGRETV